MKQALMPWGPLLIGATGLTLLTSATGVSSMVRRGLRQRHNVSPRTAGTAASLLLLLAAGGMVAAAAGIAVAAALALWRYRREQRQNHKRTQQQFRQLLTALRSGAAAGQRPPAVITELAAGMAPPMGPLLRRAVAEMNQGISAAQALHTLGPELRLSEWCSLTAPLAIIERSGAPIEPLIEQIETTLRARERLAARARSATAQARAQMGIMAGLLPALMSAIALLDPVWFRNTWGSTNGTLILAVAAGMVLAALAWAHRILQSHRP